VSYLEEGKCIRLLRVVCVIHVAMNDLQNGDVVVKKAVVCR